MFQDKRPIVNMHEQNQEYGGLYIQLVHFVEKCADMIVKQEYPYQKEIAKE